MAEFLSTNIYGDLYVNGIINKGNDAALTTNHFMFENSSYVIPTVIWHGRINVVSPATYTTYQNNNCTISVSYISTGVVSVTMSGSNIPSSTSSYYVLANAIGRDGNTTSDQAYISSPSDYKTINSFRLIVADDASNNNGYIELSIIKLIKF